jgi:sugar phosphate isomerase/epimerase
MQSFSQKVTNEFFTLHNIIRGDTTYDTFDEQVALVKSAGYDGIEINSEESFEDMKAALEKHRFKASYLYAKITLDEPFMDSRMEDIIRQLKGTKTIIAPYIIGNQAFPPGLRGADTLVIRILKQLSHWANASGLQVAIYPHNGYYIARTDHAMAIAKQANQKNLGCLLIFVTGWQPPPCPNEAGYRLISASCDLT